MSGTDCEHVCLSAELERYARYACERAAAVVQAGSALETG